MDANSPTSYYLVGFEDVKYRQLISLLQDGSGWTPLMIAVSLKDSEDLVNLFLRKEADVNAKSLFSILKPKLPSLPRSIC
jgi:ankyrin repeat protein